MQNSYEGGFDDGEEHRIGSKAKALLAYGVGVVSLTALA